MVVVKRIALALCALAVLVFALIGVLHTFRGTPVSGVAQVGGGERGVGDPVFRAATEALIETPLQGGNDVEILDNGDETFPLLWRDLAGARRSIDIRLYYMEPGGLAQKLKRVLVERARAGVPVRLLYDAVGSSLPDSYVDSLRAAGVRALAYRP
ncbi:MAG TPA: hypothetical protein VFL93_06430, partial [Longimicrobiaceae bacterium]|nr:hypothetical protein [Longimicrobiaceae bacterium]